jgi:hypothetical protein
VEAAFGGSSSQVVVRKPASAEFDHLYANLSFRSAAAATVAFGGPVSVLGTLVAGGASAPIGELTLKGMASSNVEIALIEGDTSNGWVAGVVIGDDRFSLSRFVSPSTYTEWLAISPTGILTAPGQVVVGAAVATPAAELTIKGSLSANADLMMIEGDTANGWNVGVVIADDRLAFSRFVSPSTYTERFSISAAGLVTIPGTLDVTGATTLSTATLSGVLTLPAGGVGTPSQRFTGDPDTGPYLFAPDNYRLQAGGTDCAVFAKIGAFGYFSVPGRLALTPSGSGVATPATVTSKYPLYDSGGSVIGYIPIYATL